VVRLDIVVEETPFAVCTMGCVESCCSLEKLVLICILHFIFDLVPNFRIPYKVQIIISKEQKGTT